jgi:hypothetical protein
VSRKGRDVVDVAGDGCIGDIGDGIVIALMFIVVAVLAIFVVVPAIVAVLDLLIVLAVAGLGSVGRVLLRRPWVIEATDGHLRYRWRTIGWRASRRKIDDVASEFAVGLPMSGEPVLPRPG